MIQVRIWDLPTRLFHWALAALVIALIITGNVGGDAMVWHFRCGYSVLTLVIFRVCWGFVGGYWSRWRQLACTPAELVKYFKSNNFFSLGHNPVGSVSVLAMLLFLSLQVATGLFSDDEISNAGPLTSLVSERLVGMATQWHKSFGKLIIFFLVITHVLAIGWYFFKKKNNLIKAMVDGNKLSPEPAQSSNDQPRDWLKALVILLFCAGLVYALIQSGAAPMLSALN